MDQISSIESIIHSSIRRFWQCLRMIRQMECAVKQAFITTHCEIWVSNIWWEIPLQLIKFHYKKLSISSEPFTEYKIIVVAITTKHDGNASTPVVQRTDVTGPSSPLVTVLSCEKDGAILLRWKRPLIYFNTIDFYIVSYKSIERNFNQQFQINASAEHVETEVCIHSLELD